MRTIMEWIRYQMPVILGALFCVAVVALLDFVILDRSP